MSVPLLSHLTLNTGHLARTPREDVGEFVAARLRPVINNEGGPIPTMDGWFLDFFFPLTEQGARKEGGAFFQIADEPGTSKRPVVMGMAAWLPAMSESAWDKLLLGYRAMKPTLKAVGLWRGPPAKPLQVPWLAVYLTPFIGIADTVTLKKFGDLERCVAWSLIP